MCASGKVDVPKGVLAKSVLCSVPGGRAKDNSVLQNGGHNYRNIILESSMPSLKGSRRDGNLKCRLCA